MKTTMLLTEEKIKGKTIFANMVLVSFRFSTDAISQRFYLGNAYQNRKNMSATQFTELSETYNDAMSEKDFVPVLRSYIEKMIGLNDLHSEKPNIKRKSFSLLYWILEYNAPDILKRISTWAENERIDIEISIY